MILGKHMHGWAYLSKGHIKNTHLPKKKKKYNDVLSGVLPKGEKEVQQQMSLLDV